MKKLFVLALPMLALAACGINQNPAATGEGTQDAARVETVYDIAYIAIDSLVNSYNRYIDLSSEFETKATRIQNDLEARARRLQNELIDAQEKVSKGLVTRSQAADLQTQLETKSNAFEMERQTRIGELAEEEQVMTNQIMYAIRDYIAGFNRDYRFKMILTTSGGSPVLHADPALDITAEVLKGLNDAYAAERAAAGKK